MELHEMNQRTREFAAMLPPFPLDDNIADTRDEPQQLRPDEAEASTIYTNEVLGNDDQ